MTDYEELNYKKIKLNNETTFKPKMIIKQTKDPNRLCTLNLKKILTLWLKGVIYMLLLSCMNFKQAVTTKNNT